LLDAFNVTIIKISDNLDEQQEVIEEERSWEEAGERPLEVKISSRVSEERTIAAVGTR
jgi:hypothetical protein